MTQVAIKKQVADSVTAALEAQAATMACNRISILLKQMCRGKQSNICYWKMEDELYNLTVKGNDLKPYVRRFQELAVLCSNMVPNTEKLLEAFIKGLPRSIEGNVTASKP
ncbi:reverse transcriptase domain-containing protein [Tanacetum coccineum]